jgi:eukaryotic-like serine/threonine-protein kinase
VSQAIQDLVGSLPDLYAVEREIGQGGMAIVFLATDRRLGRHVAVKVLKLEIARQLGTERFLREIEIVGHLSHPHILPLLDSGQSGEVLWYVMPYVDGETLGSLLRREGPLPVERAVGIALDVASALAWAHAHGIIHRDIKPANILLEGDQAIVADFGLARAIHIAGGESLTSGGLVVGTPAYMSPEQADPKAVLDGRCDVYSLGCTLYEMLAGQPPFLGSSHQAVIVQHMGGPVPSIRVLRPSVPAWLDAALSRSLAKIPADRYGSADEFAAALKNRAVPSSGRTLRRAGAVVAAVVLLVVAGLLGRRLFRASTPLDKSLVAVAPFDAFDPALALWREGMVDILSSNLDGAGPLRSVSPSVVIRDWKGRADNTTALRLARSKGAGLVVVGRLLRASGDSVRATVVLLDVASGRRLGEAEQRESLARMDRLGDSLTVAILQQVGQAAEPRTRRLSSLGAASLPALKAFLQGEHFLRQASWDSALTWYSAALQTDSTFALALWRTQMARAWLNWGLPDPQGDDFGRRAGAYNHGLAPRESLLITVDSLWSSLSADDSLVWQRTRRVFSTLDEASRRYPTDPFVWYQVGAARYHLAPPSDFTMRQMLDAFDRAIALDSGFVVAYLTHPVQLAMILGGVNEARRYTRAYLRVSTPGVEDSAARLSDQLMATNGLASPQTAPLLRAASAQVLYRTASTLDMWFDSSETAVGIARLMIQDRPRSPQWGDAEVLRLRLARLLAQRGHLAEAYKAFTPLIDHRGPDDENLELFTELALLGVVSADSARQVFDDWLRASPRGAIFALAWWARVGDTAALARAAAVQDSLATAGDTPARRQLARYGVAAARAYEALARADSTVADAKFAALPDSLCQDCYLDWMTRATLLLRSRQPREARRLLTRVVTFAWTVPSYAGASLLLGRAEERLGDTAAAIHAYRATADAWTHADAGLQPQVDEARKALARLRPT